MIVIALILAASGFGYALVRGSSPDPAEALAPENAGPEAATRSAAFPTPPSDPTMTISAAPPGPCGRGREREGIASPADIVPAPAADYRFRRTYGSEVGNAPDLVDAGRHAGAFVFDASIDRPVLGFSGRAGLALTPATGVVYPGTYSIELLFRFDQVGGFRKVLDFKDGSVDDGLYVLDGCLSFFPETLRPTTAIKLNAYAHVVLTRDSAERVVGYVDGVEQFAFDDTAGRAVIASDTLRFFVDDAETRREYSDGAVTGIRLYDRALTGNEVAALACSVRAVPLSTEGCPG